MKKIKIDLRTLLIVLSIMAILSSVSGGYLYYASLSEYSEVKAHKDATEQLKDLGNNIDNFLSWSLLSVKSMAGLKELKQSLITTNSETLIETTTILERFCNDLNVSVCYLMDPSGNTIASSNHGELNSFVGKNYGFRPYFKQAIQGKPSVYMALGITSMERGIYYSHPVFSKEGKPLGVAVIKASIEIIERDFLKPLQGIVMLTDPHGLVFVSNRPDWLYHLLWQTSSEIIEEIEKQSQFGKGPWNWIGIKLINQDHAIDSLGNEYRVHKQGLANYPDWNLIYLHSHDEILETVIGPLRKSIGVIVISLCIFFGFIVIFLFLKANSEIIQRKAAEIELQENEALLEATGFMARVGGWQLDVETMAVSWTKETYNIHEVPIDYKPQLDKAIEFFHPDDRSALSQAIQRALGLGESYDMDLRFITAKGNNLWTRSICQPEIVDGKTVRLRGTFQDITVRKRVEEELQRKEKDLRESQRIAHVGSWRLDVVTNQVVWTEELYKIYGLDSSLPPPPYTEHMKLFTPESWERLSTALARTRETGIPYTLELETVRKDGSNGWMWVQGEADVDSAGKTVELWGAAQDITDRKQAEAQQVKSHELLSNLARLVPGVIYQYRLYPDGRSEFPYASPGMNDIYEVTPEEVREDATPVYGRLHPDDYDYVVDTIQESARTLQTFYCEFRVILPRKGLCWRWSQAHPERMIDGSILWHGIISDVTERKQAEEKLRVSHEKLLTILDSIDSIVYVADRDTYEILFMNEKMITDFGGDKTGEKCFSAFRKRSEPCVFCNNDRLVDADGRPVGVLTWHDQNKITGKYYINHYRAIEWADGRLVRLQIATDITELKEMEARLTQAQKMESIGTLAGGIAHDFNNILFPIVGHTEILLEDAPEDSPLRDSLKEIYTGALRARDLVQQILAFARHETNELKLMKMQPIIKEAMKMIRSTIPTTINITQNLQPNCGAVKADPTQIHQIVMNLATNAYHAMEKDGGELKVSLKEIELDKDKLISPDMTPGLYACLTVADNGMGMNKDIMSRIFDPFFTTKEKGKGTGMGLSVVHGIVKRIQGEIQVYSEPGKGTEFLVYLPVVESSSEKQGPETDETIPGGIEKILLVDDEKAIISMEKQILSRLGYQVTSRTSSIEALEAFRSKPDTFDLVITDMSMPKMSGDKLAVELIKIRPDIPILLCTGYSETMTPEKIKFLGIKDFLMKPIVIKDLAKKIREVLDK